MVAQSIDVRALKERKAEGKLEKLRRVERMQQSNLHGGLIHFVRHFWGVLEPNKELVEGWALHAICAHLEAVTRGEIKKLLINVPPGFMKSLLCNVFWPAWEWSAAGLPGLRYVTFSYAAHLTERDNGKFRDLLRSRDFQELWGHAVKLTEDGKIRISNAATGWKFASSVRGVGTGERGDRVILDDPHNVKEGESEAVRSETVRWVREGMSNRLNDMVTGVIVVIMQRVHEDDVSGAIIKDRMNYVYLCIPMEYERANHFSNDWFDDPREEQGELAWPERFPQSVVDDLRGTLGPYAYSGQYQQNPEPRGGGIIKRKWWRKYNLPIGAKPRHLPEFVVASLDPAFTAKEENDPSGFVVIGVYRDNGQPRILLMHAWEKWLELHGETQDAKDGETKRAFLNRTRKEWGLVEQVANDCERLKVDLLLIENKASGHSVAQEIRRLYSYADKTWGVRLVDPGTIDKRNRLISVQHLFADGLIEAPFDDKSGQFRDWADIVIDETAKFRGVSGDKDNLVDALVQALKFLRDDGRIVRREEREITEHEAKRHKPKREPLYPV